MAGSVIDGPDVGSPATSSVPPSRVPGSMGVLGSLPQSASHRNAAGGDPKGSEDRADRTTEEQPNSLLRLLRPHSTTRECGRSRRPIGPICRVGRCGARSRTSECARSAPRSRLAPGPSRPTSAPSTGPICRVGRCGARSRTSECARSAPRSRLAPGPSRPTSAPHPTGPICRVGRCGARYARPSAPLRWSPLTGPAAARRVPDRWAGTARQVILNGPQRAVTRAETSSRPHVRAPDGMSRQRTVQDSAGGRSTTHTRGKRSPRCRSTTRRGADGRRCY